MKKLLPKLASFALAIVLLIPGTAFAGIGYDTISSANGGNSTTISWTHVTTASDPNTEMVVGAMDFGATDPTDCSYNSVAMTESGTGVNGGSLWTLKAPASGSHTVSCNWAGFGNKLGVATTYTGVKQTGNPEAANSASGTGTSKTVTLTTVADLAWVVGVFSKTSTPNDITAGANTTIRGGINAGNGMVKIGDTNADQTPAGSHAVTGSTGDAATVWGVRGVSLAPVVAATPPDQQGDFVMFGDW